MEKVAIVILNYLNYTDTIECIESISNDNYPNKEVVVVDNGSTNESWSLLNKKYLNSNIHLLRSDKNLGFAKGNNIGIEFSRNALNARFILLVNNDTIFNQSNLIQNLMNSYEKNIAIIGPRIVSSDNHEQNPVEAIVTKERLLEEYKIYNSLEYRFYHSRFYTSLRNNDYFILLKRKVKSLIPNQPITTEYLHKVNDNIASEDLVLHGSCMLLTKDYFNYYPNLFPGTFLYYEENILTLLTKKVGLKKKYINNCSIFHKEDQSSKMSFKNLNKVKMKFLLQSMKECELLFNMSYNEIVLKYFKH